MALIIVPLWSITSATLRNSKPEVSSNFISATNDIGKLVWNETNEISISFSLLYRGYIPIIPLDDGFKIEANWVVPSLERMENYSAAIDLLNIAFGEIKLLKKINLNLFAEIDFRKEKERLLGLELSTTELYWKNQVKRERLIWGASGAGAGAMLVLIIVLIILL